MDSLAATPRLLRGLTLLWGLYAMVWMALEAGVGRDVLLAAWGLALLAGHLAARRLGGRPISAGAALGWGAAAGLAAGVALGPSLLLLMALKTGLHSHGPAYSATQMAQMAARWPWWIAAATAAGAGLGLLALARRGR